MLLECRVPYKQRYRSQVNSNTVSDQTQFLTDTAGKDKAFWTLLLLLHEDNAYSLATCHPHKEQRKGQKQPRC